MPTPRADLSGAVRHADGSGAAYGASGPASGGVVAYLSISAREDGLRVYLRLDVQHCSNTGGAKANGRIQPDTFRFWFAP